MRNAAATGQQKKSVTLRYQAVILVLLAYITLRESAYQISSTFSNEKITIGVLSSPSSSVGKYGLLSLLDPVASGGQKVTSDDLARYRQQFAFSMGTDACQATLRNQTLLQGLARSAMVDWYQQNKNDKLASHLYPHWKEIPKIVKKQTKKSHPIQFQTMEEAEKEWSRIFRLCHPLLLTEQHATSHDEPFLQNLTLRGFFRSSVEAGRPKQQSYIYPHFNNNEWALGGWRDRAEVALIRNEYQEGTLKAYRAKRKLPLPFTPFENYFIMMAMCGLRVEFPLRLPSIEEELGSTTNVSFNSMDRGSMTYPTTTNQQKKPGWKPKRVVLLSATLGKQGAGMGCRLINTAFFRGWEVALIEGPYRGIKHKFSDASMALQLLISTSSIAAEDTLVVFADSMDVLVNQGPDYVAEAFLNMTTTFSISAEHACFPLSSFPHSLGIPGAVCGTFPRSDNPFHSGFQFANTGGWVGLASSAFIFLEEMSSIIYPEEKDPLVRSLLQPCADHGTDQLFGNGAHRKDPTLVGLDLAYSVFSTGSWGVSDNYQLEFLPSPDWKNYTIWKNYTVNEEKNQVFCHKEQKTSCPALLHYNGGKGSDGGSLQLHYERLISGEALRQCSPGRLLIANVKEGTVHKSDFARADYWSLCRASNHCTRSRENELTF